MPRKTYTEEFKRDAVALYENSAGTSIQKIANDLGINRMTLKNWITKYGANSTPHGANTATALSEAERIRQLEKENALLREERDIVAESGQIFRGRDETLDPLPIR